MREALKSLRSDALIYGFGQALGRGVQFLLVPLLTRLLSPEVYGVSDLVLAYSLIVLFGNDVLRVTFQPWKFIALNVTQAVVTAALSWWLVAGRHLGVAGILYAKLAGDACTALLALALIRLNFTPRINRDALKRMIAYGAPLVPVSLAYGVIFAADRYALQHFRSLAEVGVYAVAVKFFSLVMLGVQAFSLAFFPFAHARAADPDAPRIYAVVLARYLVLASLLAL